MLHLLGSSNCVVVVGVSIIAVVVVVGIVACAIFSCLDVLIVLGVVRSDIIVHNIVTELFVFLLFFASLIFFSLSRKYYYKIPAYRLILGRFFTMHPTSQ